jgi:SAM-dependent methyltransferase
MSPAPPLTLSAWLRYDLIERALAEADEVETVLEIGAGQGALGARLAERYTYTGVEPDPVACRKARERIEARGGRVLCGAEEELDDGVYDLVCAFEVLEHIADDRAALRAWSARLVTGGRLMLTVPPFQRRFGAADWRVGHLRRYEPGDLAAVLQSAGFVDVRVALFGFPAGRLLEIGRNLLARARRSDGSATQLSGESGRWAQPPDRLGGLTFALALPARLAQRPFIGGSRGSGLFAVARRGAPGYPSDAS